MLKQSFNRPNIHYTVVMLDVQPLPGALVAGPSARTSLAGHPSPAAAAVGLEGSCSSLPGDEGVSDGDADVDHSGYEHLLQLLVSPVQEQPAEVTKAGHLQQQQKQKQRNQGPVTIVYVLKRKTVDVLVRRLRGVGLEVAGYHAAMKDATRRDVSCGPVLLLLSRRC